MKPYCDLGGTPNKEGKHILPNRIIRSGCLNHLRPWQAKELRAHRLAKVIDLRTEVETSDTGGVLDGDLDRFIEAYLKRR